MGRWVVWVNAGGGGGGVGRIRLNAGTLGLGSAVISPAPTTGLIPF